MSTRYQNANKSGFTLIELLVVIGVIGLLMAILVPVLNRARELGQRTVCQSNLKQLTLAWILYADEHDGRLVSGRGGRDFTDGSRVLKSWIGEAFFQPTTRADVLEHPEKGTLWPYIGNIDVYGCPRHQGRQPHLPREITVATYTTVVSANVGFRIEGTATLGRNRWLVTPGRRVGKTVLHLTRMTDIVSPSAAQRAVFADVGITFHDSFAVEYLNPKYRTGARLVSHAKGTTLSMADGHAEYWRWQGRETVDRNLYVPGDTEPKTEDGLYDLQRLQRVIWGRLGY